MGNHRLYPARSCPGRWRLYTPTPRSPAIDFMASIGNPKSLFTRAHPPEPLSTPPATIPCHRAPAGQPGEPPAGRQMAEEVEQQAALPSEKLIQTYGTVSTLWS